SSRSGKPIPRREKLMDGADGQDSELDAVPRLVKTREGRSPARGPACLTYTPPSPKLSPLSWKGSSTSWSFGRTIRSSERCAKRTSRTSTFRPAHASPKWAVVRGPWRGHSPLDRVSETWSALTHHRSSSRRVESSRGIAAISHLSRATHAR